jgi:alpha/beta superfamily hydrolase
VVRKGEYLERAVAFPGDAGALEGLYHRGAARPPLLIAPPHPRSGGSMELPLIAELAWAVTRAGHPTLRFNYRGVGASGGEFDEAAGAVADARRALEHLRATTGGPAIPVALLGVGFGAGVVAALAAEDGAAPIEGLVLVTPELGGLPGPDAIADAIAGVETELVLIAAEEEALPSREALRRIATGAHRGRLAVIPGADRAFLKGLVDLGRVVADAVRGFA